jgi:hypothetical protein
MSLKTCRCGFTTLKMCHPCYIRRCLMFDKRFASSLASSRGARIHTRIHTRITHALSSMIIRHDYVHVLQVIFIVQFNSISSIITNKCTFFLYSCYTFTLCTPDDGGTRWRSWLRHCATSRKVADSIPDGVVGIFHWHIPFGCTMAPVSTQPLTEMSTRNISWW